MATKEYNVCLRCGKRYKTKDKIAFGMWMAACDICGKVDWCAAAGHDFGIYELPIVVHKCTGKGN